MWKTEQKVLKFVEEHHLITTGDVLVAGVSGGADSVCLYYLLLELQRYKQTSEINKVHFVISQLVQSIFAG